MEKNINISMKDATEKEEVCFLVLILINKSIIQVIYIIVKDYILFSMLQLEDMYGSTMVHLQWWFY